MVKVLKVDKILMCVILAAFCIYGSTKPPPQPPVPPQYNIPLHLEIGYNSISITPEVPSALRDNLAGQRCIVQILTDGGGWQTLKDISYYDLTEIPVQGVFVSGGQGRVRCVRLFWPLFQYESDAEVSQ